MSSFDKEQVSTIVGNYLATLPDVYNVNFRNVRKHVEKKMGLERKSLSEHKEELKQIMADEARKILEKQESEKEKKEKVEKKKKSEKKKVEKKESPKPPKEMKVDSEENQDPEPKRPCTSYMLFVNDKRPELLEKNKDLKVTELGKILGKQWKEMDKEERKVYEDQAAELKAKFTEEMEAWKQRNPNAKTRSELKKEKKLEREEKKKEKESKPKSAYFYYCQEKKELLMKENANLEKSEITKLCQEGWKALSAEEKKPYQEKHASVKQEVVAEPKEEQKEKMKKPRAPTAYLLYCEAHREEVKKKNPDDTPTMIMKKLGESWKNISEKEKKQFEEEAQKKKEEVAEYMKEMEAKGIVFVSKLETKQATVTEETVFNSAESLYIEEKMEEYRKEHEDMTKMVAKRELKQQYEALSGSDKFEYEKKRFKRMETFFTE